MVNFIVSKQPPTFSFGQNVDIFLDRIEAHFKAAKLETTLVLHFDTLITFLDSKSIYKVKQLEFTDANKTNGSADLFKSRTILKAVLSDSTNIPPEVFCAIESNLGTSQ